MEDLGFVHDMPDYVLRVSLAEVLKGGGKISERSGGDAKTLELLSSCDHTDAFISHTWNSLGCPKCMGFGHALYFCEGVARDPPRCVLVLLTVFKVLFCLRTHLMAGYLVMPARLSQRCSSASCSISSCAWSMRCFKRTP